MLEGVAIFKSWGGGYFSKCWGVIDAKFGGIRREEANILGISLGNTPPKAVIWGGMQKSF